MAKPMKGLGSGVYEIALRYKGGAYRTVYLLLSGEAIWGGSRIPEEIKEWHQDAII